MAAQLTLIGILSLKTLSPRHQLRSHDAPTGVWDGYTASLTLISFSTWNFEPERCHLFNLCYAPERYSQVFEPRHFLLRCHPTARSSNMICMIATPRHGMPDVSTVQTLKAIPNLRMFQYYSAAVPYEPDNATQKFRTFSEFNG